MDKPLKFPKPLPLPSLEVLESGPAAAPGPCHRPGEAGRAALLIPASGEMERAFNYLSQRLIPPSRRPGEVGQPRGPHREHREGTGAAASPAAPAGACQRLPSGLRTRETMLAGTRARGSSGEPSVAMGAMPAPR